MSRPNIIRADTLDLQDHENPSAKDHSNQPAHPAPLGEGPAAPHQGASLRQAQEDRAAEQDYLVEQWGSGRSSHEGSELLDEETDFLTDSSTLAVDENSMHQNGSMARSSEDSDMTDADDENGVDDDMVDKISSSPSIDDEDIDFEFVYALHTFVATVEGQANATKGDTMQLLDDSNSYWWLVRVCKDSSIGYLPAEHIETPTERLARLNKHRNADLSSAHLSDNEVKTKNVFKRALKRNNTKMVQFTTPTYYEASEIDWSEEEDQEGADGESEDNANDHQGADSDQSTLTDEKAAEVANNAQNAAVQNAAPSPTAAVAEFNQPLDTDRPSSDSLERSDSGSRRSRNGNIRNTDSFFKDETAEPKKMSLTPSILRDSDQSLGSVNSSRFSDSKDSTGSPVSDIFDNKDKTSPTSDKFKEDKKKKKEKSGMLSGLFKRKEKKIKVDEAAGGTVRTSRDDLEGIIGSPTSTSPDTSSAPSPKDQSPATSRRPSNAGGKLTKAPPSSSLPSQTNVTHQPSLTTGSANTVPGSLRTTQPGPSNTSNVTSPPATSRAPVQNTVDPRIDRQQNLRIQTQPTPQEPVKKEGGIFSPISGLGRDPSEPKKEKLKKAKQRMELDVDSSPEPERDATPPANTRNAAHTPPPRMAPPAAPQEEPFDVQRSVSPVDKAPVGQRFPPALEPSKALEPSPDSPVSPSTPTESTSTINTPETASEEPKESTAATSTTPDSKARHGSTGEEPDWDYSALHSYMETRSANDVKDLLHIVYDKNEVKPVSRDHPIMRQLNFEQTQKQLDSISTDLDNLFNSWRARKATKKKVAAYA